MIFAILSALSSLACSSCVVAASWSPVMSSASIGSKVLCLSLGRTWCWVLLGPCILVTI